MVARLLPNSNLGSHPDLLRPTACRVKEGFRDTDSTSRLRPEKRLLSRCRICVGESAECRVGETLRQETTASPQLVH